MSSLVERLRKARENAVAVGDWKFTFRRPTDYEAAKIYADNLSQFDVARKYVIGWKGIVERDLLPSSGGDQAVPFDRELWAEWLQDRPDLWEPIYTAIVDAYRRHRGLDEEAAKNSEPGSSTETPQASSQES